MIIDTNNRTTPHLDCLRQRGVHTVIRYYCRHTRQPEKELTRAEAEALIRGGIKLGVVYQGAATSGASFSSESGAADGAHARRYAETVIGQPRGSAIYFAVDYDAPAADIRSRIVPYFRAVRQAMMDQSGTVAYRIGAYGSGAVCQTLLDEGLVSLTWVSQSSGFSGTRDFLRSERWNLHQRLPTTLCGMSVDPNDVNPQSPDFGAFEQIEGLGGMRAAGMVGASAGASAIEIRVIQEELRRLNYPPGDIDGVYGPLTRSALLAFQADNNLPKTGVADAATVAALGLAQPRPLDPHRITIGPGDLAGRGSVIITQADRTKLVALISSILGALGIGNSAVTQIANTSAAPPNIGIAGPITTQLPSGAYQFLADLVQALSNPANLNNATTTRLTNELGQLQQAAVKSLVSPDNIQAIDQLRALLPQTLQKSEQLAPIFQQADTLRQANPQLRTIVDVLPTFFANGSVMQTISDALATTSSSIIPGFGGSLTMLAIGLAARYFSNQVIQARVQDHATAGNRRR